MKITLKLDRQTKKDGTKTILFDVIHGSSKSPHHIRKTVSTKLSVNKSNFDLKNFRATLTDPNQVIINKAISKLKDNLTTAIVNFETGVWSANQVIQFLKGEVAYDSVDAYINTVLKQKKSQATYLDYKYTLNAFKKHLNIDSTTPVSFGEFSNFTQLEAFKMNAQKNGIANSSINSYFVKIRAIMNDAYDNGVVHDKFILNKKLRLPSKRKLIETCSTKEFEEAIEKINSIYDWQSLAFYLLMFCTRGMYLADIVNFKKVNLKNDEFEHKDFGKIGMLALKGYDYLIHKRSKTKHRGNDDMIIRIDAEPTMQLISSLKRTVYYTHYRKNKNVVPSLEDEVAIFKYNVDTDYILHSSLWDVYKKRVKKLLGYPYKTARKTFNTYALELEMSDSIRRILLGHIDDSMLSHYDNTNTSKIQQQVEDAHISILKEFKAKHLTKLLLSKLNTLDIPTVYHYENTIHLDIKHLESSLKNNAL